jgi:hypothetical protein
MLLRYAHDDMEDTVLQISSIKKVAWMDDRTQGTKGKVAWTNDWTLEGKVMRTKERTSERNSHNF